VAVVVGFIRTPRAEQAVRVVAQVVSPVEGVLGAQALQVKDLEVAMEQERDLVVQVQVLVEAVPGESAEHQLPAPL